MNNFNYTNRIFKDGIPGYFPVEMVSARGSPSKVKISLGSIQTGQSKDMVVRVSVPSDYVEKKVKAGEPYGPIIRATLTYHNNKGHTYTHGEDNMYDPTGGRAFVPAEAKTMRERFREAMRDRPGYDDYKNNGADAKDAKDEPEDVEPRIVVRTDGLYIHLRPGADRAWGEEGIVASDSPTRVPSETEEKIINLEIDSQYLRLMAVNILADFDAIQAPRVRTFFSEHILS
jgi:hypothetical protein